MLYTEIEIQDYGVSILILGYTKENLTKLNISGPMENYVLTIFFIQLFKI